jgi:hypothetical protein
MFAIDGYDNAGNYIMIKSRIDEMWEMFASDLSAAGYKDYDEPSESEKPVPWKWVAGSLGTILVFSAVLCIAWLNKANNELKK